MATGFSYLGFMTFYGTGVVIALRYQATQADLELPPEYVLELPLDRLQLVDAVDPSPLRGPTTQIELPKVVAALKHAAGDRRCQGLVTYVGARENLGGLATVQELRGAISRFRKKVTAARLAAGHGNSSMEGAPASVAFAASYGDAAGYGSGGMLPYLLASACDRVYLQPLGLMGLQGPTVPGGPFTRHESKGAAASSITPCNAGLPSGPQGESFQAALADLEAQAVAEVAASRGVDGEAVREAVKAAPLLPAAALQRGLLDGANYQDEVQSLYKRADPVEQYKRSLEKNGILQQLRETSHSLSQIPLVPIDKYIQVLEKQHAAKARQWCRWFAGTPLAGYFMYKAPHGYLSQGTAALERYPGVGPVEDRVDDWLEPCIAVVTVSGTIVQGPVPPGSLAASQPTTSSSSSSNSSAAHIHRVVDAAKLVADLRMMMDDHLVRAVVVRVNSPGGSALASDSIRRELQRLKTLGKTVVVSMGDVAAGGAYYIASAANAVVAQPGTVTGGIGAAENKTVTAAPLKHVQDELVGQVAKSRGRAMWEMQQLAHGRVYTGRQAYDIGLVDQLGGLEEAISHAKALADLDEDVSVYEHPLRRLPLELTLFKRSGIVAGAAGDGSISSDLRSAIVSGLAEMGAVMVLAAAAVGLPVSAGGRFAAAVGGGGPGGADGRGAAQLGPAGPRPALPQLGGEPHYMYSTDAATLVTQV
ncbi:hypothetical protein CHLRE_06g251550v5 [Chlamydomonas reinhardtii]|uniref:Peptidase S49 domain-containing protein n=1 Tax=Chlamydomonas reinhardtii TaxID=3055 RepID=A0A2K3DLZ5_CHLRE|nr:uncharacterized protein CHLRE_06g251550v5 [Chlamydomonas reinhardtii]PNW81557.1 hypothetical protein CHLRE_06g251550v5 [Chlamydomonas reinhardtii]